MSHANLIAGLEQNMFMRYLDTPHEMSNSRAGERWIGFLPLYHAYGQLFMILMAAKLQCSVYVIAEFAFERFLDVIERYKITVLHVMPPPLLVMLSKRPEAARHDLSSGQGHAVRRGTAVGRAAEYMLGEVRGPDSTGLGPNRVHLRLRHAARGRLGLQLIHREAHAQR